MQNKNSELCSALLCSPAAVLEHSTALNGAAYLQSGKNFSH